MSKIKYDALDVECILYMKGKKLAVEDILFVLGPHGYGYTDFKEVTLVDFLSLKGSYPHYFEIEE